MSNHILKAEPALEPYKNGILALFDMLVQVFEEDNTLFLCGNGGSFADCLHIGGELLKSFENDRGLTDGQKAGFKGLYGEEALCNHLEQGLRAHVLGCNVSLNTALMNDSSEKEILFAQELFTMGRNGDVLLGISTSGNARNVMLAVSAAKSIGMRTAVLTGKTGGDLKGMVDTAVIVDKKITREVQQVHEMIYHTLCLMLEDHFFSE